MKNLLWYFFLLAFCLLAITISASYQAGYAKGISVEKQMKEMLK